MFPVRCYTCNAPISAVYVEYARRTAAGEHPQNLMDALHVSRMCCRRMFLGHVELVSDQIEYGNVDVQMDQSGTTIRRRVKPGRVISCE